jgi:hypothetical protein
MLTKNGIIDLGNLISRHLQLDITKLYILHATEGTAVSIQQQPTFACTTFLHTWIEGETLFVRVFIQITSLYTQSSQNCTFEYLYKNYGPPGCRIKRSKLLRSHQRCIGCMIERVRRGWKKWFTQDDHEVSRLFSEDIALSRVIRCVECGSQDNWWCSCQVSRQMRLRGADPSSLG